jgi:hypothetical protein
MVQTIRLHHVLQEAVATPYCNLVTRSTGVAVRDRIEAALADSDCSTAVLDFSQVGCLDFSCADEIVAKFLLISGLVGRVVVLGGVREEQRETLDHVLSHHRLAVAALFEEGATADLLGWVTPDARALFANLSDEGPADPAALADRLAWPAARTHLAIDDLARHRFVAWADGVVRSLAFP